MHTVCKYEWGLWTIYEWIANSSLQTEICLSFVRTQRDVSMVHHESTNCMWTIHNPYAKDFVHNCVLGLALAHCVIRMRLHKDRQIPQNSLFWQFYHTVMFYITPSSRMHFPQCDSRFKYIFQAIFWDTILLSIYSWFKRCNIGETLPCNDFFDQGVQKEVIRGQIQDCTESVWLWKCRTAPSSPSQLSPLYSLTLSIWILNFPPFSARCFFRIRMCRSWRKGSITYSLLILFIFESIHTL